MLKMHEIRELIKLVDQSSLSDFEYEFEGLKISLKKEAKYISAAVPSVQVEQVKAHEKTISPVAEASPSAPVVQEQPVADQVQAAGHAEGLHKICSPMVGTFYKSSAPDADPYVKVGDKVSDSTVVCIVEAMKLMNEIEAEVRGEIVEILVENGQLVEYGQPLFLVKPE